MQTALPMAGSRQIPVYGSFAGSQVQGLPQFRPDGVNNRSIVNQTYLPVQGATLQQSRPVAFPYSTLPQGSFYPPTMYQIPQQQYLPPHYLVQPVPVIRRHPQYDLNPNFNYEQANFLCCEAKIVENTIHCVVCNSDYKTSQKQQHIKKHIRHPHSKGIDPLTLQKLNAYKPEPQKGYITKPIVEPEQFIVKYDPNIYKLIQQVTYQDEKSIDKIEAGIGNEANNNSFHYFDNNVSQQHAVSGPYQFQSEPNPFFSKYESQPVHQYEVPAFEIPKPKVAESYHPIQQEVEKPIEQSHRQTIPMANSLNQYQPSEYVSNQFVNSINKSQSPQLSNPHTSYHPENARQMSQPVFDYPPQEPINTRPIQERESFSGPHSIKLPPNEQSKKDTDVNISQLLREINGENAEIEMPAEGRKKLPTHSEW